MPLVQKARAASGQVLYQFGYPIGVTQSGTTYLNNHLKFTVLYNEPTKGRDVGAFSSLGELETSDSAGFRVVGFEVEAASAAHEGIHETVLRAERKTCPVTDTVKPQELKAGIHITFTYDVKYVVSSTRWATRWDPLLEADPELKQIQWFSVVNSLFITRKWCLMPRDVTSVSLLACAMLTCSHPCSHRRLLFSRLIARSP
jgi:Endomembrane protein 70